jgi:hypothetical protein
VNSIFYYAPTIFADVGVKASPQASSALAPLTLLPPQEPLVAGLICGAANLIGTLIGLRLVDAQAAPPPISEHAFSL